jgi:hypothetical protein
VFEVASEMVVRVFGDVAVIRYQARIEIVLSGQLDTGLFWHTDVYERREGSGRPSGRRRPVAPPSIAAGTANPTRPSSARERWHARSSA